MLDSANEIQVEILNLYSILSFIQVVIIILKDVLSRQIDGKPYLNLYVSRLKFRVWSVYNWKN